MQIRFLVILLLAYCSSFSQGGASSVYSQYGFGLQYPHQFGQSFGMGNTGIAMSSPLHLNLFNPASVADLKYVTFDVGAISNSIFAKDGINTPASSTDASLGAMGIGIPLLKNWGAFVGLSPFSSVGYRIANSYTDANLGPVTDYHQGFGGVNSVFLGTGYRYKNISAGAKANYLFGTVIHDQLRVLNSAFLNTFLESQYVFSNFTFDFGVLYKINVNDNLNFTLGAVYGMQQQMDVKSSGFELSTTQTVLTDVLDTNFVYNGVSYPKYKSKIYDNTNTPVHSTLSYPQYFGGGLTMNYKEQLILTFDYKQQEWRKFEPTNSTAYTTSRNYAFGAEWIPNKNSVGTENYHKRVAYRMGLHYGNLPLHINNTDILDYGFNVGIGLPLRKLKFERELFGSYINVGFEMGRRGTINAGLVQDDYYKVNIGFTFNDKWFIKRKFD